MDSHLIMYSQHPHQLDAIPPCMQLKGATTPTALYFHQQRALEVIELIEVPAPPRAEYQYSNATSSVATSSTCSSSSESEEEASSYCSTEPDAMDSEPASAPDDTYKTRLSRVLLWRENYEKAMGTFVSPVPQTTLCPPLLKRKSGSDGEDDFDDGASSHCSKRSRASVSLKSHRRLSAHSCPACDTCFATRQSLQEHGRDAGLNDACREAVEYGFES